MNELTEHDQLVNAKLAAMKADDWQSIRDMSSAELDEFMDELNATGRLYDAENPFVILRGEAAKAVSDERLARTRRVMLENQQKENRRDCVRQAAFALNNARACVDKISEINLSELFEAPPQLQLITTIDSVGADDAELVPMLQTYSQQAKNARESQAVCSDRAAAFSFAKSRDARRAADFFSSLVEAWNACAEVASANAQLIANELDRRRAEREAEAEAMRPKSLLERIEQLESQLAEKEGN